MNKVIIRPIDPKDNKQLATLIRAIFEEYKVEKVGTVYSDPATDTLFEYFSEPGAEYWVAEYNGKLLGGCGFYPTEKLPEKCAELVKFYLTPSSRGKGVGALLFNKTIERAASSGYKQLYLESFPQFERAISIYEQLGFKYIPHALGNSGHCACTVFMMKDLLEQ